MQDLLAKLVALQLELLPVEEHAVPLHAEEHRHERHLDRLVDALQLLIGRDAGIEKIVQRKRAVCVLRGIFGGARKIDRGEGNARGAFADHFFLREECPAAMPLRETPELVLFVHFEDVGLDEGVMHAARELDAVVR